MRLYVLLQLAISIFLWLKYLNYYFINNSTNILLTFNWIFYNLTLYFVQWNHVYDYPVVFVTFHLSNGYRPEQIKYLISIVKEFARQNVFYKICFGMLNKWNTNIWNEI